MIKYNPSHTPLEQLKSYLQINTSHPTPDYDTCTEFLVEYAKDLRLECEVCCVCCVC